MPFVKLDTRILQSTLWFERDARELFITALLMAEPREIQEITPQLKVDSLEHTGFSVPPGWYGFVPAAGIGIIRQAAMDRESGMKALAELGNPDIESRSKDFEGRRLVRVDGGFVVLNFVKYRDRDTTTAVRSKRWRQRQKEIKTSQCDSVTPHRDEAFVDTKAEVRVQSSEFRDKSTSDGSARASGDGLEKAVLEIAALYPKIRDPIHISQEIQHAIAQAVARDGRDLVWAGTKGMADAVARWPKDKLVFIPAAGRFFRESQYRTDPAEWERGDNGGSSKKQQRIDDNRKAIVEGLGLSSNAGPGEPDLRQREVSRRGASVAALPAGNHPRSD